MRRIAILALLALEFALCGCGYNPPRNSVTTSTSGNWEAQLIGGTGPSSQLNFVTSFGVTTFNGEDQQALTIDGFGFFNSTTCFATSQSTTEVTESGNATLTTNSAGQVSGSFNYTVSSLINSNVLVLSTGTTGGVNGTSNASTTTAGTLSNGVIWGTWQLTSADPTCIPPNGGQASGTFVMCQGTTSCTVP